MFLVNVGKWSLIDARIKFESDICIDFFYTKMNQFKGLSADSIPMISIYFFPFCLLRTS